MHNAPVGTGTYGDKAIPPLDDTARCLADASQFGDYCMLSVCCCGYPSGSGGATWRLGF